MTRRTESPMYMMWYDDHKDVPTDTRIAEAVAHYEAKYKRNARTALVRGGSTFDPSKFPALDIRAVGDSTASTIGANEVWISGSTDTPTTTAHVEPAIERDIRRPTSDEPSDVPAAPSEQAPRVLDVPKTAPSRMALAGRRTAPKRASVS